MKRLLPLTNCYDCHHYDYDTTKAGKRRVQCEIQQGYSKWVYVKDGENDVMVLFKTCPLRIEPEEDWKPRCFLRQGVPGCRGILERFGYDSPHDGDYYPDKRFAIECAKCPFLETEYDGDEELSDIIKKRQRASIENQWSYKRE
jgi:hypothetical protein